MISACPGLTSTTFSALASNAVWITGLSLAATTTSSFSYQYAGLIPFGSLSTKASPWPSKPHIAYPPSKSDAEDLRTLPRSRVSAIFSEIDRLSRPSAFKESNLAWFSTSK